jgi:hypothetical protein
VVARLLKFVPSKNEICMLRTFPNNFLVPYLAKIQNDFFLFFTRVPVDFNGETFF